MKTRNKRKASVLEKDEVEESNNNSNNNNYEVKATSSTNKRLRTPTHFTFSEEDISLFSQYKRISALEARIFTNVFDVHHFMEDGEHKYFLKIALDQYVSNHLQSLTNNVNNNSNNSYITTDSDSDEVRDRTKPNKLKIKIGKL